MKRRHLIRTIEREIPDLKRYALSLKRNPDDAEDLVQDTLERAISRIHQFRPGTEMRRWLFTILHHIHIDDCRKANRRGTSIPVEEWHAETARPAEQEAHMRVREIEGRLRELRPCDRVTVLLSAFTDQSQDSIAERTNVAVGTVKSRLSRAREALAA
jgi:RNA polymerase sigma-70 factor (ECF subfamily)